MAGLAKHSITIAGHRTSFSLEDPFWQELKDIAEREGRSLSQVVAHIDNQRGPEENLSSSLRVFVLNDLKRRVEPHAAPIASA